MFDEKFWLAIAFFTFASAIIKFIWPKIAKSLDQKSKEVAEEILAAKEMKDRAEKLLAKAETFYKESSTFSEKLIKDAEIEAQKFLIEAQKSAEEEVNKKTAAAFERIKQEEEKAIRQMKNDIISSALKIAEESLESSLNKKTSDDIIAKSTQDLEKTIH